MDTGIRGGSLLVEPEALARGNPWATSLRKYARVAYLSRAMTPAFLDDILTWSIPCRASPMPIYADG